MLSAFNLTLITFFYGQLLQEAHREIMRQRHENSDGEEIPNANPLAGATSGVGVANGKCALPSCIAI